MKSEQAAFGERIRAALRWAQISESPAELVPLLARFGSAVSQQTVSNWLNGKSLPRQQNLRALAQLLHMEPHVLLFGAEAGRRIADARPEWKLGALDQHAVDKFRALPPPQRKLLRELIDVLATAGRAGEKKR